MAEEKKQIIKKPEDVLGKPNQRYLLEMEEAAAGVERFYFWFLNFLRGVAPSGVSCQKVWKIKDIYAATETSSYFGSIEQRKGIQQDKASQYLATIGKMIKDLFQIIRELRIMDERYDFYKESEAGKEDSEVALKSIWIDLVEGGAKNPTSVLGLSTQVGFTILPDLFFTVNPLIKDFEKAETDLSKPVQEEIAKLDKKYGKEAEGGVNRKIREVLGRKLIQYLVWKRQTKREIVQRRSFMLKYLRQHYNVIKMYINWLRPYLVNLRRLQMKQDHEDPDLISAFETSKIELELIGSWASEDKPIQPIIRMRFTYVTIPQMAYQQEYQRGAIHVGKTTVDIESYVLEKETIEKYRQAVEDEDLELLEGVTVAMNALKDDLKKYLREEGEEFKEDVKKVMEEANVSEEKAKEILGKNKWDAEASIKLLKAQDKKSSNPFSGVGKDFRDMFGIQKKDEKKKTSSLKPYELKKQKEDAANLSRSLTFVVYDVFKKAHRMNSW